MGERPTWIPAEDHDGFRIQATDHWSWEGVVTGEPTNYHRVTIIQRTGVLCVGGRIVEERPGQTDWSTIYGWHDKPIRDLYLKTVAALKEKGIDIPPPDPRFSEIENLVNGLVLDQSTKVDPLKLPLKAGTPIVLRQLLKPGLYEPDNRSSKLLQIGKVGAYETNSGLFTSEDRIFPAQPFLTVEFHHFTPDEEHVTGVFRRYSQLWTRRGNLFNISQRELDRILKVATPYIKPEGESEEAQRERLFASLRPTRS